MNLQIDGVTIADIQENDAAMLLKMFASGNGYVMRAEYQLEREQAVAFTSQGRVEQFASQFTASITLRGSVPV
jgi:hypothetical protein